MTGCSMPIIDNYPHFKVKREDLVGSWITELDKGLRDGYTGTHYPEATKLILRLKPDGTYAIHYGSESKKLKRYSETGMSWAIGKFNSFSTSANRDDYVLLKNMRYYPEELDSGNRWIICDENNKCRADRKYNGEGQFELHQTDQKNYYDNNLVLCEISADLDVCYKKIEETY